MSGIPGVNEKDWKLLRRRLPDWQEAYMDRLNHEYTELLRGEGKASDKFWTLEKRIREDKRDTGVVAEMKRSNMKFILMNLLDEGAITVEDLDGFSEELKDSLETYVTLIQRRDNR